MVGQTPLVQILAQGRDNRYRNPDLLFENALGENTKASLRSKAGEFYRVTGTVSSIAKSLKKMDAPRSVGFKSHKFWPQAKRFVLNEYVSLFAQHTRVRQADEILPALTLTTAAGQPWQALGLKKKQDCLKSNGFLNYLFEPPEAHQPPVWKVSPKTEWYPASKLDADKVRTFIVPPFHLLYYQKALYETQNMAMKEFHWSAYGFNPYQGGVDRLARKLLLNKIFMFYDVVGWDRVLPCMPTVYSLRNRFHQKSEAAWRMAMWVTENTVHTFLLQPDGKIFKKDIGNNSGSGNTTSDNILAHTFILCLTLLELYNGDEAKVKLACASLFGDDNIMSIPDVDEGVDIEEVFTRIYGLFGLSFDPFVIQRTLEGCEFLGFKFHKITDGWIPTYNQPRLVAAFCYTIEKKHTPSVSISRMWALTVMCAGCDRDVFNEMSSGLYQALQYLQDDEDPTGKALVPRGVPDYDSIINFYLGREGGQDIAKLFNGGRSAEIIFD
jgi:hypothetical protein